jgi:hypothetical protein
VAATQHTVKRPGAWSPGGRRFLGVVVSVAWATVLVLSAVCSLSAAAATVNPSHKQPTRPPGTRPPVVSSYWLVASDGGIFAFGGAPFYGSTGSMTLNKPVVGMAGTPGSKGYWLVASDGGIFTFGDAQFYGSTGAMTLNKPVVAMAATPTGGGYWLVASDGGIFAFGSAQFYGSMGGRTLYQPIVGMAAAPSGNGYWLVAADGGMFAFGSAQFFGSTGGQVLNRPIVGMAPTADGGGYWFTAADGGVFAYGDARFDGSLGGVPQHYPIVAITTDATSNGYWFTNDNGAVTAFGTAKYWGSAPQVLNKPVVGIARANAMGHVSGSTYPSGAYGYDISTYQCGDFPTDPHTIGIVQVNGASLGAVNPCLKEEASWSAGGLNLYTYLTFGTAPTSPDAACNTLPSPQACNYGFNAALYAFDAAEQATVPTLVGWWLDVETRARSWSTTTAANASLVQGAIDGLHSAGINNVGIYASPANWNGIVGPYQPAVPYWMADWTTTGPDSCSQAGSWAAKELLPTGPVAIVQFSDHYNGTFDGDYAC